MKTKTASIRLDKELFDNIDQVCEKEACSRNDFIKNAIDQRLNGSNGHAQNSQTPKASGIIESKVKPNNYVIMLDRDFKQTNVPKFDLDLPSDCTLIHVNGKYYRTCKNDNEKWDEIRKDLPEFRNV
ncbi:MAG TPA: ribbon-helix-helix domain-containing protein [Nitrosopumilaceae archaeon]|nr:ribbon-helix-helix domain-containing protein [Nitrosopumilaceae archaeon]